MFKIENAGKFIPAGDTVFRVQENYKATRVLEIAEDRNGAVKSGGELILLRQHSPGKATPCRGSVDSKAHKIAPRQKG